MPFRVPSLDDVRVPPTESSRFDGIYDWAGESDTLFMGRLLHILAVLSANVVYRQALPVIKLMLVAGVISTSLEVCLMQIHLREADGDLKRPGKGPGKLLV
ncbi:unnamed protein product [Strongylus vulgaris]|uniref:Uncharacterized protein n=1 Tax=Strongylus vulgaris TaxID=40348 RepID=A0A3P7KKM7_STRVU|nr:unnamed protein product [Strongylus vulgaris]